ncbi:NLR family CARD domain-containing protein 4 isoform X1 [Bufo gargarizans]|uniref:NLR family CARD domain-containing protein 4 isoform X1 n=2 Tax=Bufo gargarizans TaxID=30331 RepID=UPI001CF4723A|nr:NLR family CARD domain-containing protein 4 isoform X1 [Bufo gargarizans]XP_044148083.1 NLR family CARD domain-containing protein 4 isoform X1 [Bufo gargarizans]XP_044148084.1 NLR family CARD domain-containing protein 4 isoform X1 [Bufo gargarizans]
MELIRENFSNLTEKINITISTKLVEKLFEQHVFTVEEMNCVLAEKTSHTAARTLIMMIILKGEESCNFFLQLLKTFDESLFRDVFGSTFCDRKETFESLIKGKPKRDKDAMSSITEEDIDELEAFLKRFYHSPYFQNFKPLGEETDIDIIFKLETTFTDPFLWKKDIYNHRKEKIKFEDVLWNIPSPCIIEGEAGKGKTTMLKRIAALWASEICQHLQVYKLVFFISLRGTSTGLYETLCDQVFPVTYNWSKETFLQKLRKLGEKVLFLLDGYDEFSSESCREIDELIKQNYKFNCKVIVTTRTESIGQVRGYGALIVETSDFTIESAKTLITNVLHKEEATDLLDQLDASDFMKNLMKTPLFVVIACTLRMGETEFQMNTQTALFCTLYNLMIDRGHSKNKDVEEHITEENIHFCGDLALNGLFDHKYEFRKEHLSNIKEDILLKIGLLNKYGAQKAKPGYRFFHTSFQEYTAGRRLSQLLSSDKTDHLKKGQCYLNKLQTMYDVTNKYKNLLLYTCGSSKTATQKVICHIKKLCKEKKDETSSDFVEFGINLFYESATKKEMNEEFKPIFSGKILHISMHNIGSHHVEFFEHLPGCLSALQLVKLDLFAKKRTLARDENSKCPGDLNELEPQTYISKKVVNLFYGWTQVLQTLEVTIKKFDYLAKSDIKFLGKICCCAEHLRLNISSSSGITGNLTRVVDNCKRMRELIINSTPVSVDDEARIAEMTNLKTLSISNMDKAIGQGILLDGLHKLFEIDKLILHNISMNEKDGEILANGISHLKKLEVLKLSVLPNIGSSMEHVVQSISHCDKMKELCLINCCLTSNTFIILSHNLKNFTNLEILDLSDNFLEDNGKQSVETFSQTLTHLTSLTTLLLPGGTDVKCGLDELLYHLEGLPRLSKLGFRRWNLTDDDVIKLGAHFTKGFGQLSFLDLSFNCVGNNGWIFLMQALQNLKNLKYLDFSTEGTFSPIGDVVQTLCSLVKLLPCLSSLKLDNWELDNIDIGKMKNIKFTHRGGEAFEHFFLADKN